MCKPESLSPGSTSSLSAYGFFQLLKKTIPSPSNWLCSLLLCQRVADHIVWVGPFLDSYTVPLIYVSILLPTSHCLHYYITVCNKSGSIESSNIFFFSIVLAILEFCLFLKTSVLVCWYPCWDFDRDHVPHVDQDRKIWYLKILSLIIYKCGISLIYVNILLKFCRFSHINFC